MNKKIDEDLEFIKGFSKISVQKICTKKNINRGNLLNGRSSRINSKLVRKGIESEVAKLYIEKEGNEDEIKEMGTKPTSN